MERNSEQLAQFQYDSSKTREENLEAFAKAIIEKQTFNLCTWKNTVACMYLTDNYVLYNRITLCTMGSTLTKADHDHLLGCMKREIMARGIYNKKGDYKKRKEYISLFSYMELRKELKEYKFEKHERPDFKLSYGTKTIGIEITSFTTQSEEIGGKIFRHSGDDVAKMQEYASKEHRTFAANCRFLTLGGPAIQYPVENITNAYCSFRDQLIEKTHKYSDEEINQYDEFIILCDATTQAFIGERSDVEDILHAIPGLTGNYNNKGKKKVIVLYTDNWSSEIESYECSFDVPQH